MDISSKFDSLDNTKFTSSCSKGKLERSGKGLINSLGFKTKNKVAKIQKARYAIRIISEKDISNIIKDFNKIEKRPHEKKRPKHGPTESYFDLAKHIAKCMMISKSLNWYNHGGYKEMTSPYSNVYVTNKNKSKHSIVKKDLLQKCSAKEKELCSTKEDESEANKKQKDAKIEVACDVTNYF